MGYSADIANAVLPVFMVIALGYYLRRKAFLGPELSMALNRLVFYVSAPALLFRNAALAPLSEVLDPGFTGVVFSATLLCAWPTYWIASLVRDRSVRGVVSQGSFRSNMVFVGLPVVFSAYGEAGVQSVAVLIGMTVLLYNVLAVFVLFIPHARSVGHSLKWSGAMRDVIFNPLVLGSAAGLAFSATSLPLPAGIDRALELVERTAAPLALITVGASLEIVKLKGKMGLSLFTSLWKLILYPGMVYVGLRWMGGTGVPLHATVILTAAPTAVVSYVMASEMKGDEKLAGSIILVSTVLSFFTLFFWLALLSRLE
jgi:predicted permease